jgi:hypothetical protein
MAVFAQPSKDENLTPGWNVQGGSNGNGKPGTGAPGYAMPGVTGSVSTSSQSGAGLPSPPQAEDVGMDTALNDTSILENESYSVSPTTQIGQSITWTGAAIPASGTPLAQPFGMSAVMTVAGGTVTALSYTPFGSATAVEMEAGSATGVVIPGGALVTLTYSAAPTGVTFVTTGM